MRVGQNPAKFVENVDPAQRITVVVVTYLPFLQGYFAQGLEVLKTCLTSLWENTDLPFDLLVFDNGSGPETVAFLQDLHRAGRIEYLVLSRHNVGKGGAWDFAFRAAPGEIVAYADGDVYFAPGWLTAGVELLEAYPRVGMVSCRPMRTDPEFSTATVDWAGQLPGVQLERGAWMPWEIFREHDRNLGHSESEVRKRFEETEDVRLTYQGKTALVGAVHWQFVARRDVLQEFLPLALERPMGQVSRLDERMNRAGYLRIMTPSVYVRHLGNTLPREQQGRAGPLSPRDRPTAGRGPLHWAPIRRFLLWVHHTIFRWYYRGG